MAKMLRVEKATLGNFREQELIRLINSGGVEAILPHSLDDRHLMLIADQFRDLMAGVGRDRKDCSGRAALPLTLLLLSRAGAKCTDDIMEVDLEVLQDALSLLSATFDREIVNRILNRQDRTPTGTALMLGLELLIQFAEKPADSACPV